MILVALAALASTGLVVAYARSALGIESTLPKIVSFTVELPDGQWVRTMQPVGGMVRISNPGIGMFGLSPRAGTGIGLALDVFELTGEIRSVQTAEFVDRVVVTLGERIALESPDFNITVNRIDDFYDATAVAAFGGRSCSPVGVSANEANRLLPDVAPWLPGSGNGLSVACCVRCGQTEACACLVAMACGNCCDEPCCQI